MRVEAFSKMRAMLRPAIRWRSVPARFSWRSCAGQVDEGEELLLGEVDLLQEASSVQVHDCQVSV